MKTMSSTIALHGSEYRLQLMYNISAFQIANMPLSMLTSFIQSSPVNQTRRTCDDDAA